MASHLCLWLVQPEYQCPQSTSGTEQHGYDETGFASIGSCSRPNDVPSLKAEICVEDQEIPGYCN